jgi:tetratricopeptide (TPR) repeat protein
MFLAGRSAEAVEALWRALSFWPEGARAAEALELAFAIGKCIMEGAGKRQADIEQAAAIFERILRLDPAGSAADDATLCLGRSLESLGKPAEAAAQYEHLCKAFPESPCRAEAEARLGLCRMRGAQKGAVSDAAAPDMRHDGQVRLKEEVAEEGSLEAEKKYRRGLFYMGQGKNEAARVCMKSVVDRSPGTKWAVLAREALVKLGGGEQSR